MSYTYRKMHVDSAKFKLKCPYTMNAEYITVHNTANSASALNEAKYHNNNSNQVSYHIAIDDIEAIEVIPLNRNAWHCGDGRGNGNMKSIGIEICYSKNGGNRYDKAEENAIHLIAKMLHERKWDIKRVKKHEDFSGKYCPHRILDRKNGWQEFLNKVQIELDKLNNTTDKGDDELKFTSPTLKSQLETRLDSKASKDMIIDSAIKELGYSDSWKTKQIEDGDIIAMAVELAIKLIKEKESKSK